MIRPLKAIGLAGCVLCLFFLIVSCSALKTEKKLKSEREISKNSVISPSFDCAKATTEVEKLICSDAELAKLDREMTDKYNAMYQKMKKENPNNLDSYNHVYPKQLVWRQRKWIEQRNTLKDIVSLKKAYKEQIRAIESYEYLKGFYERISNATTLKKKEIPPYPEELKKEKYKYIRPSYDYLRQIYTQLNEGSYEKKLSFDCSKTTIEAEELICNDAELKLLDAEEKFLSDWFHEYVFTRSYRSSDQEEWLKSRNNFECTPTNTDKKSCLKSLYKQRIQMWHNRYLANFFRFSSDYFYVFADLAISQGADINGSGYWNDTCPAFMWYAPRSYEPLTQKIYEYMVSHGANLGKTYPDCYFGGLIRMATTKETILFLLKHGADINTTDSDNTTVLFSLSFFPAQFLLELGANPNIQRKSDGETALHLLASSTITNPKIKYELIKSFVDFGADVSIKNKYGKTALDHYLTEVDRYIKKKKNKRISPENLMYIEKTKALLK